MAGDHLDEEESGSEEQDQVQLDRLQPSEPFFHSHDPAKPRGERSYFILDTSQNHDGSICREIGYRCSISLLLWQAFSIPLVLRLEKVKF